MTNLSSTDPILGGSGCLVTSYFCTDNQQLEVQLQSGNKYPEPPRNSFLRGPSVSSVRWDAGLAALRSLPAVVVTLPGAPFLNTRQLSNVAVVLMGSRPQPAPPPPQLSSKRRKGEQRDTCTKSDYSSNGSVRSSRFAVTRKLAPCESAWNPLGVEQCVSQAMSTSPPVLAKLNQTWGSNAR